VKNNIRPSNVVHIFFIKYYYIYIIKHKKKEIRLHNKKRNFKNALYIYIYCFISAYHLIYVRITNDRKEHLHTAMLNDDY